jgi:hypothetical protein
LGYQIIYRKGSRNWYQKTIGDYVSGVDEWHERFLDSFHNGLYERKKRRYNEMKVKGIKGLPPLRRGARLVPYPRYHIYHMDVPAEVQDLKRFSWFIPQWHQDRTSNEEKTPSCQKSLLALIPNLLTTPRISPLSRGLIHYLPKFRSPEIVQKECFCNSMNHDSWAITHASLRVKGLVQYIFYLNSFDCIDDVCYSTDSSHPFQGKCLPSDIVKMELFRLLSGINGIEDFFRVWEMSPHALSDELAIIMNHSLPTSHRFTSLLKSIGQQPIQTLFNSLVAEARQLKLIKDQIHIWDGQFHETWLQSMKPRKITLPQFYGGKYNHGGKKVGVGVVESTIMDWNGTCTIPLFTKVFPANLNENTIVQQTVPLYYQGNLHKPKYFLTDKGPSGKETQTIIYDQGIWPIIPVKSNMRSGTIITPTKKHRFFADLLPNMDPSLFELLYNIRTRIEEHYNLNDTVFHLAQLHLAGEELTNIEIILENCLGVLIPLTAFKIGRPDLMWSPCSFRQTGITPSTVFPERFQQLDHLRWVERSSNPFSHYQGRSIHTLREN